MPGNRRILFSGALIAMAFAGENPVGSAQESTCSVRAFPRLDGEHAYYEIVAVQFPRNQPARLSWRRAEPAEPPLQSRPAAGGQSSSIPDCPVSGNASGSSERLIAHLGKNPDGSVCEVSPGQWEVRVETGSCVADAKLSVPVKVRVGAIVGLWGGADIGLHATAGITTIDFFCARGVINHPLVPDSNNSFDLPGTYASTKLGQALPDLPARYVGRIDGPTMTLKVTVDNITQSYTLSQGQTPPPLRACR